MSLSPFDQTARAAAIALGLTTYTRENGQRYTIRNLSNPRHAENYGGQGGRDELSGARKGNRGGGTGGSRMRNELLSTPPGANRTAFGNAMAAANAMGMEGHHVNPIYLTGNALQDMDPERRVQYFERFRRAGVSIGNQAENVMPLSNTKPAPNKPSPHRQAHVEGEALQNRLKLMEQMKPSASGTPAKPPKPKPATLRSTLQTFFKGGLDALPSSLGIPDQTPTIAGMTNERLLDIASQTGRLYIPIAD